MAADLTLSDHPFRIEEGLATGSGVSTPLRLLPSGDEESPLPLSIFAREAGTVLSLLDSLNVNCLWVIHPGGFSNQDLGRVETIEANTRPNLNTQIHTHQGRALDVTFSRAKDCTRLDLQFFSFETIWQFVKENWTAIQAICEEPLVCSFHDPINGNFDSIRRGWSIFDSFLSQFRVCPDPPNGRVQPEWEDHLSLFFGALPHLTSPTAASLMEKVKCLIPNAAMPWGLPEAPSAGIFRGFHRAEGIQGYDEKARVSNAPLAWRPLTI